MRHITTFPLEVLSTHPYLDLIFRLSKLSHIKPLLVLHPVLWVLAPRPLFLFSFDFFYTQGREKSPKFT